MASDFPYLGIDEYFPFPPVERTDNNGIVGQGGNLSPGMLLSAYRQGIFPWFSEGQPLLWWSPDPRFILRPSEHHLSRSLRRFLRKNPFRFTVDTDFAQVIRACSSTPRPGQDGTWITGDMIDGYLRLHQEGFAHSVEVWRGNEMVGGLYGVAVGSVFAGESMFSHADNASKAALAALASELLLRGIPVIDCQIFTEHIAAAGGVEISREAYLRVLKQNLATDRFGDMWRRKEDFGSALARRVHE